VSEEARANEEARASEEASERHDVDELIRRERNPARSPSFERNRSK